jgi:hydroxymethylbilane synthase
VGVAAELTIITTQGDTRAPDTAWGEGAFVTAIEARLFGGEIDVAVHSAKDVPTDEDPRLAIAAYLPRAPQGDVLVFPSDKPGASLDDLAAGARVGTDSPRRTAFLRAVRPDLGLHPLHGNVDTRLRRLDEGQSDALVLAEAGLTRLGRADRISLRLPPELVPPAPGQGAIAVQCRTTDEATRAALARLDDPGTRVAVELERAVLAASGGGCRAPLGVAVTNHPDGRVDVLAGFARPDGSLATIHRAVDVEPDEGLAGRVVADLAAAATRLAHAQGWPTILVTRAADQAPALALALVDRGLAPVLVPTIAIEAERAGAEAALDALPASDWVVVTSANAVRSLAAAAADRGVALGGNGHRSRWAAVGNATARALRASEVEVAYRPPRASARDLAATLPLAPGDRVLVPRGDLADESAIRELGSRGAAVTAVIAYRTVEAPEPSLEALRVALARHPSAAVVTSGSTVRGLIALADRLGEGAAVRSIPLVAIGDESAAEARRLGFTVGATASRQAVAAIAEATAGYLRPNLEAS